MSKKRPREATAADTRLIEIYDDLANEDEEIRLKAAHALLSQFSYKDTPIEQHKTILKRLFRGLCSGRKAARLGFSVALTEFLSEVFLPYTNDQKINAPEIIDLLESQTAVDGSTSGQDERDHYFGRLFGAEALVKSSILFTSEQTAGRSALEAWEKLVDIVCGIAVKKPWLREQCGWLFCSCVKNLSKDGNSYLIKALVHHKLLRTPEGVAIWLNQEDTNRKALQLEGLWKHGSPLSRKGASTLADIMKDAKPQQADSDGNLDSQGKAMWSPQLHFAWDLVLRELYQEASDDRVSFKDFWLRVVDQGLFASSSSVERKHWGLLVLAKVFTEAPESAIAHVMTPNTILCLQNQLKADSRYLQRSAQKAIQAIHARVTKQNELALVVLRGMLVDAGALQFDLITKTKTIEKLVTVDDNWHIGDFLGALFQQPPVGSNIEAKNARKIIADLLASACAHRLAADQEFRESTTEEDAGMFAYKRSQLVQSRHAMEVLVKVAFFVDPAATPEVTPASRQYARERIMVCLEQALKQKTIGRALLRHTTAYISVLKSKRLRPAFDFDENIEAIMRDACRRLDAVSGSLFLDEDSGQRDNEDFSENDTSSADEDSEDESGHSAGHKTTLGKSVDETYGSDTTGGTHLLYHLALLQVYSGEAEAVTIVEDLNAYHEKLADDDQSFVGSDVLIEVLLTFASKPSKFLRKISLQAFSSFAAQITEEGLQSLIRVLETKENLQGQGEMFDAEGPEDDMMNGIDGEDSDAQVDSDVEEISDGGEGMSREASDAELNGQGDKEEEEDDEQLARFDAMLAAALGTRKGEDDLAASDTSGSDEDMSDSEMEALDEKLTEVFRARKELAKPKKKEHKDAKENIVNFKNRVLDLVDIYLKQEHTNPLSMQLVLPLLRLAQKTNVKQLADRACSILREFNGRCRGAKLPQLQQKDHIQAGLGIFHEIHHEAGLQGSNAHAAACSSASILLVRVLSNAGIGAGTLWGVYAATGTRMLEDTDCHVQPAFFTDWNNWCANARKAAAK